MTALRPLVAILIAVAAALGLAAPAFANTTFDDVGRALRSDPLYVDPQAEISLSAAGQADIRSAIDGAGTPIFVAVLPTAALTSANNDPNVALDRLRSATGRPGTYAVLIGTSNSDFGFQARSTVGTVGDLANEAYLENPGDPAATILSFVDAVAGRSAAGDFTSPGAAGASRTGSAANVWPLLIILGLAGVAAGGAVWITRRRAKQKLAISTAAVRKTLDEDITAYGEALDALDPDLSDPRLGDEGRQDLQAALDHYEQAKYAAVGMTKPDDAVNVTSALDEGRWRVACVAARLAGEPLPEHRPPCFFDPRHGLSVSDVPFAPPGAAVRDVPACQACATAVADGYVPNTRMVDADGVPTPYYNSGPAYAGYTNGYYRSNADLMTTVFMATMVGSMFMHSPTAYYVGDGGMSGGDGGNWGGGDSGGGWFDGGGGGGFSGGDFGGGGW